MVAEAWLKRFSWLGLVLAVLIGATSLLIVKRKAKKAAENAESSTDEAEREPVPAAE
ncbi:hypothetical protein STRIP9103_01289 [Streptomyces ipomoeae 91-03]|uniref:Uncharacterized protein n=1 Tax=Streptomyces ipomoeae 91-03 TaxID=698759 RepID=L1KLN9_9ACTN|nr:hypothetical protein STRIP9103_01289 [Streptomyces ipomoeae 91-03]